MFKVVGVGVALVARVAFADPYPEEVVDRPIVLNPGMTQVDANEEFTSTTNGALRNRQFSLGADHAFGPIEIDAFLGYNATLGVAYATGAIPGAVYFNATTGAPQSNDTLFESQSIGVLHKAILVPRAFALRLDAGVALAENRATDQTWTHVLEPNASVNAEAQLAPFVAAIFGLAAGVPVEHSGANVYSSVLNLGGSLMVTVDNDWDFYAHAGYDNVTRSFKYPYIGVGVARRFGR